MLLEEREHVLVDLAVLVRREPAVLAARHGDELVRDAGLVERLVVVDPLSKPVLKKAGLLTRDPRVKERKKFGLKRARKAPQFSKR